MRLKSLLIILTFLINLPHQPHAQSLLQDSILHALLIEFQYGYFFPAADMKARFGQCSALGPGIKFKSKKNFIIGAEGHFLFGGQVKESDILQHITTHKEGFLIGAEGTYENYTLSERGFLMKTETGKIFSFDRPNINSGIYIAAGIGFMQHKIRIEVDEGNVPHLSKEYKKGYDRLCNGIAVSQTIGYRYFSPHRFLNLFVAFEITEAFTRSRRTWYFDKNSQANEHRVDVLYGLKAGLVIPIYREPTEKYYYY